MSVVARILSCCALVIAAAGAAPVMAQPQTQMQPPASSTCIDQMETEPDGDDLEAIPVADTVDGGCLTSADPISI